MAHWSLIEVVSAIAQPLCQPHTQLHEPCTPTLPRSSFLCRFFSAFSNTTYLMNTPMRMRKLACPRTKPCVNVHVEDEMMGAGVVEAPARRAVGVAVNAEADCHADSVVAAGALFTMMEW